MNIAVTQYRHVDEMRPWSDREHLLECVAVTPEAADVMTFTFKPDNPGHWFRYLPGQFVTLELPVGPEPVMRTYTLSSSPSRPYTVSITVTDRPITGLSITHSGPTQLGDATAFTATVADASKPSRPPHEQDV